MIRPGTIGWFALHEARLAWRDWLSLVTAGHRRRTRTVALACIAFVLLAHGLAWLILASSANVSGMAGKHALVVITGMLLAAWSMMLSQAMEAVTRAFYTRGDLDLILTSPATASRLFAARIVAMVVTIMFMTLVLGAPFINVLVWRGGVHWLGTYVVIAGLAMDAVAVAAALAVALFRGIGPRRTRAIAQIVAAVIGAAFAIAVQFAAISSFGTMSRMAVLQSPMLMKLAPDVGSAFWWPARAALGEPAAMAAFLGVSVVVLVSAIHVCAPRFGTFALAVASVSHGTNQRGRRQASFHSVSPTRALRRKEWTLLLRDPWLMSQTLMQLLYLLPAAFLLWRGFYARGGASSLLVPVLIVAAGQLSGALAWLAVSGEDAPELVASAPVSAASVLRAKTEAVLGGIAVVFAPFVVVLAATVPFAALVAFFGIAIAAGSATAIQFWFRAQARRSLFRRRQTSSRVATYAEALSSIGWAGTGALAATGTWLAVFPGLIVFAIVGGTWMISPNRKASGR
jgi:ABC-2 type transport system permease protein